VVESKCPVLAQTAGQIGDPMVRNMGTIGGSLAHADPAADYPAAIIALGAEMVAEGPKGKRSIKADDFFKGLLTTALGPDEILTEVRVPVCGPAVGCAYLKFPHPASRFAVVGVAAVLTMEGGKVSKAGIGITGAGTKAVRAKGVEAALMGKALDAASIQAAAEKAAEGVDVQADLQGSVEYKQHLLKVFAKRAIEAAAKK
jgi:carbon-monoxide dehydrogenase medium subunit